MEIKRYKQEEEAQLMTLLRAEGDNWKCYWAPNNATSYEAALRNSITYVAFCEHTICGCCRSINENNLYIYVCDLLVASSFRGDSIWQKLIDIVRQDFPQQTIYIMSFEVKPIIGSVKEKCGCC